MNTDNKKHETPTTDKAGVSFNPLLSAVRPKMASEGLALLLIGKEIEIHNETLGDFLSFIEKSEANIEIKCSVNKYNVGYSALQHCR